MGTIKEISATEARDTFFATLRLVEREKRVVITWRPNSGKKRAQKFELRLLADADETQSLLDSLRGSVIRFPPPY